MVWRQKTTLTRLPGTVVAAVAAALMLGFGLPAAGQTDNAAAYYQQAIEALDEAGFSDSQWEAFYEYQSGAGGQPSAQVDMMLRRLQPVLELTRRGSSRDYSDFGLDYSQGIELLMPHLRELRTIARIMDVDTKVRLHQGDTAGAARNLASVYQMGGHSAEDRTLISALVGNAVFALGDEGAQYGFDRGVFNEADAAVLLNAANDLRADDPFQMVESIMMEGDVFIGWVRDKLMEEGGSEMIAEAFAGNEMEAQAYRDFLDTTDIEAQFEKIDAAMGEVSAAFAMSDQDAAREKLAEVEAKIAGGEYGEIAMVLLPAYSNIYEHMVASEQMLADRKAMLEKFVRGELKVEDALNAAVLYMQAVEDWLELEPSDRQHIRTFAREHAAITDELTAALETTQPIIDALRQASQIERCDFTLMRKHRHRAALCERYVIGMRELWDLLNSDAVVTTRQNQLDQAIDRMATSLRMVTHLASDRTLAGAVTCQYAFNKTATLLVDLLDDDRLSDEHLSQLRPAVLGIERRDPFGAIDTIISLRETSVSRYVSRQPAETTLAERETIRQQAQDVYNDWTGDHYLYLRAAQEHAEMLARADGADEIIGEVTDELTLKRMDGILSLDAIEQAQRDGGYALSLQKQGELDVFAGIDIPLIADFRAKRMRARNDVRMLHRVLMLSGGLDLTPASDEPSQQTDK